MTDHNREEREALIRAVQEVTWNASNYPAKAQPHILGQDVVPLTLKIVDAVQAVFEQARTVQDAEEGEWEYGNEQLMHSRVEVLPASSEAVAKAQAWLYPVRRRRKAGPWEALPAAEGTGQPTNHEIRRQP